MGRTVSNAVPTVKIAQRNPTRSARLLVELGVDAVGDLALSKAGPEKREGRPRATSSAPNYSCLPHLLRLCGARYLRQWHGNSPGWDSQRRAARLTHCSLAPESRFLDDLDSLRSTPKWSHAEVGQPQ